MTLQDLVWPLWSKDRFQCVQHKTVRSVNTVQAGTNQVRFQNPLPGWLLIREESYPGEHRCKQERHRKFAIKQQFNWGHHFSSVPVSTANQIFWPRWSNRLLESISSPALQFWLTPPFLYLVLAELTSIPSEWRSTTAPYQSTRPIALHHSTGKRKESSQGP